MQGKKYFEFLKFLLAARKRSDNLRLKIKQNTPRIKRID